MIELMLCALSLALAVRLSGSRPRLGRILFGGIVGALLSETVRRMTQAQGLRALLGVPIAALCMALADRQGMARHPARSLLSALAACGLLGGMMTAAAGATGSRRMGIAAGLAAAVPISASLLRTRGSVSSGPAVLRITANGRTMRIPAIIDSGNTLRDYLTRRPVTVLAAEPWRARLGFPEEGEAVTGLRMLFADTAGGRQRMDCFIPDAAVLETQSGRQIIRIAAAFSAGLSENAPALVPGCAVGEQRSISEKR